MELNVESIIYTFVAVELAVAVLKGNGLNKNILATTTIILGALVYVGLSVLTVPNVIIGALIGSATTGGYESLKGLLKLFEIDWLTDLGGKKDTDDTTTGGE